MPSIAPLSVKSSIQQWPLVLPSIAAGTSGNRYSEIAGAVLRRGNVGLTLAMVNCDIVDSVCAGEMLRSERVNVAVMHPFDRNSRLDKAERITVLVISNGIKLSPSFEVVDFMLVRRSVMYANGDR